MKVSLIAYSQRVNPSEDKNPLSIIEQAASVCYNSNPTSTYKIAKACKASGHLSVIEHVSFTFHIEGVSRALLAQLTRHRIASFSVQSQRYVSMDNFQYVNPYKEGTEAAIYFDDEMNELKEDYRTFKEIYGAENEDARAILPNSCCTELYMTMNARELIQSSYLRLCTRAQKEIRELFSQIKEEVAKVCPEIANWMVPGCEKNPKYPFCPEGKSCGRHPKLSDIYIKLETTKKGE